MTRSWRRLSLRVPYRSVECFLAGNFAPPQGRRGELSQEEEGLERSLSGSYDPVNLQTDDTLSSVLF